MKNQDLIESLRALFSTEGYQRLREQLLSREDRSQSLPDPKRLLVTSVRRLYAPGEKSILSGPMLDGHFQLDHVVVPEHVTFDPATRKTRLFFHHDQIIQHRVPASLVLCLENAEAQRVFYPRRLYSPGESVVVGTFENVSDRSLDVMAALIGFTRTGLEIDEATIDEASKARGG